MSCNSIAFDPVSHTSVCSVRPSSSNIVTAGTPSQPAAAAMCTVFKLVKAGAKSTNNDTVAASSTAASHAPTRSPTPRWSIPIHSTAHLTIESFQPYQRDTYHAAQMAAASTTPPCSIECACYAQLTGHHQQHTPFSRAEIFSDANVKGRIFVCCGDEQSNQVTHNTETHTSRSQS